ncbi:MAG: cytochrome b/b6 domain-containing protein [Bacteriovoracaceae bacterium]|nr:cytochrome b/b6 domain-containing protein [Bacteriovoracaceae bacterium]
MDHSKAYDLPIRIFHWLFALLFVFSFSVAKFIDDDSVLYAYHMLSGILMVSIVLLRIVWGFVGSRTARFSSFKLNPTDLISYFNSVISSRSKRYLGHNPASSYAALLMMAFVLGIGFSGLMMSLRIYKHFFEEAHELLAHGLLITVIIHVVGVILHQLRHRDGLITSMLNGKKTKIVDERDINSNHPIVALLLILSFLNMGNYLFKNFDNNTGVLKAFGTQVQLGEKEHKDRKLKDHNGHHEEDDD